MVENLKEEFKPIPQRRRVGALGSLLFHMRLMVDLQALTIYRYIKPHLLKMSGEVLDVGCGEMPYRSVLRSNVKYTGIDVVEASDFDMDGPNDVRIFDGSNIPFETSSFDYVICTEVIEHALNPEALIAEMHRVLRPGGVLCLTVPFSARVHFAPHDYRRFTNYALSIMFSNFSATLIAPRGNDFSVVANKLIVATVRMITPNASLLLRIPGILFFGLLSLVLLGVAHLSLGLGWGSTMDPLGYSVTAKK